MRERTLHLSGGTEVWSGSVAIAGTALHEPGLGTIGGGAALLVYKGTDQRIHTNYRGPSGWLGDQQALDPAGAAITTTAEMSSPTVFETYLPFRPAQLSVYGFFPDAGGLLDVYWQDPATQRWTKTNVLEGPTRPGPIWSRPSVAYIPSSSAASYPGRVYLMYAKRSGDVPGVQRMRISYVPVSPDIGAWLPETLGMDHMFDDEWSNAWGLDLLYESGIDANLRALEVVESDSKPNDMWLNPKADGILDVDYRNADDWARIRLNLCKYTANPEELKPEPITCPGS